MSIRQVIAVRADLKMRRGKEAAQVAHASMKCILDAGYYTGKSFSIDFIHQPDLKAWLDGEFTKIVVSVSSEEELLQIYRQALQASLPAALIQDAGHTEFNGVPTYTTVAIGPAPAARLQPVTGHLPLR